MALNLTASASTLRGSRLLESSRMRFTGAVTRLSSGLRVFSAAQDAAGSFVGTKLGVRATGWQRAQKNIQDGLSAGFVADGALAQLSDQVQRIRELSIQSANGVWTDADRSVMQAEVVQLREEIDRIVQSTTFNGTLLLAGTDETDPATVDADLGGIPSVVLGSGLGTPKTKSGVYDVVLVAPGEVAELVGDRGVGGALPDPIEVTVESQGTTSTMTFNAGQDASDVAAWISTLPGMSAVVEDYYAPDPTNFLVIRSTGIGSSNSFSISAVPLGVAAPIDYIGFGSPEANGSGVDPVITIDGLPTAISATATTLTVTASSPGADADGASFALDNATLAALYSNGPPGLLGTITATASPQEIVDLELDIQAGPDSTTSHVIPLVIKPMTLGAVSLNDANTADRLGTIDITGQADAAQALAVADAALQQIAEARSRLGAGLAQLEQGLSLATVEADSSTTARSHIMDADVAKDSAVLAQEQIRSEANIAAQVHEHAESTYLLKLLTDSELAVPSGISTSSGSALAVATGSGSPLGVTSGSGSPLGVASGSGSPLGVSSAAGSPIGFSTASGAPGGASILTGSFSPIAVTPGYEATPVIGSRQPADANAALSAQSMMAMIAGSLA